MTLFSIALAGLGIMAASLAGVIFIDRNLSHFLKRNLAVLTAFSGGVFAMLAYSLFAETVEVGTAPLILVLAAVGGALFLEAVDRCLPHAHEHSETDVHTHVDAHRMLLGDAIHNIGDGIVLAAAFLADIRIGVATAAALFLHEFVQEIAEFFVLKQAGYSTKKALTYNFAVSATIFIGVILALTTARIEQLEAPLLAFAGGAFVYIVLRDILPSIRSAIRAEGRAIRFAVAALIGAALFFGIQLLTPHSHEHDEHEVASEEHAETDSTRH